MSYLSFSIFLQLAKRMYRLALVYGLCVLLSFTTLALPATAENCDNHFCRKNIDDLSAQELSDYIHAVEILTQRGSEEPNNYDDLAFIHNRAPSDDRPGGPCEHGSDLFLPWHRPHLLAFEQALRESDPPRTSNVRIPYWDWTKPPSGNFYPEAFEDNSSILYTYRNSGVSRNQSPTPHAYTGCYMQESVLNTSEWSVFGGGESRSRQGVLEQPSHNALHSSYIGGYMSNPSTAAYDPIYWSFHAFIDLLMWEWQKDNEVDSSLDAELRGMPTPTTVQDVLNTEELGYSYEYTPPECFLEPSSRTDLTMDADVPVSRFVDVALSAQQEPRLLKTFDLVIPESVDTAYIELTGVTVSEQISYEGNVFIHPKSIAFAPRNEEFRARYLAGLYSVWQTHAESAGTTELLVDISQALRRFAVTNPGETWQVTVAVIPIFPEPALAEVLSLEAKLGTVPFSEEEVDDFESVLDFDDLQLQLR